MDSNLLTITPEQVKTVDSIFPSIEQRGSKIYQILKQHFDSDKIEDYDLDSFAIYWLASRVETQLNFAATEIICLTRLVNFRHYWKLWRDIQSTGLGISSTVKQEIAKIDTTSTTT